MPFDDTDLAGILGSGVSIKGDLESMTALRFDGEIDGDLLVHESLVVGATARINGTVVSRRLNHSGRIRGDVYVLESTEIRRGGEIDGNVFTATAKIEPGSTIHGKCVVGEFADAPIAEARSRYGLV